MSGYHCLKCGKPFNEHRSQKCVDYFFNLAQIIRKERDEAHTRIKALEGVVETLVWCNRRIVPTDPVLKGFDVIASLPYCRNCHATKEQGHADKCWINEALKKLGEQDG